MRPSKYSKSELRIENRDNISQSQGPLGITRSQLEMHASPKEWERIEQRLLSVVIVVVLVRNFQGECDCFSIRRVCDLSSSCPAKLECVTGGTPGCRGLVNYRWEEDSATVHDVSSGFGGPCGSHFWWCWAGEEMAESRALALGLMTIFCFTTLIATGLSLWGSPFLKIHTIRNEGTGIVVLWSLKGTKR